jgi:hypothetical protein
LPQKTHAQWLKDGQNSPRSGYWGNKVGARNAQSRLYTRERCNAAD